MGKYIRKSRGKCIRSVIAAAAAAAAQSRKNKKHKSKKSKSKNEEQGESEMVNKFNEPIDIITNKKVQILSNNAAKFFSEQGNNHGFSDPRGAAITKIMSGQCNEMSGQCNEMFEQYNEMFGQYNEMSGQCNEMSRQCNGMSGKCNEMSKQCNDQIHHINEEFTQCPHDSNTLLLNLNESDQLDELAEHCRAEPKLDRMALIIVSENLDKSQCGPDHHHASRSATANGDALSRSNSESCIETLIPREGLIGIDKHSITFEQIESDIDRALLLVDRMDPTTTTTTTKYHAEAASSSGEDRTHKALILAMNNYPTAPLSQVHYSPYTSKFDCRKIGSIQKRASSSSSFSSSSSSSSIRAQALLEVEIEEFFFEAEERERERFVEKYNFEPLNDIPLPGRYEWVPNPSLSPD